MAQPAWDMKWAQVQLEHKIGLTAEERMWIMRNNQFPNVRSFWTTYKRALNFVHDADKVAAVRKGLNFLRTIMRSGFNLHDPKFKIIDDGKPYVHPKIII